MLDIERLAAVRAQIKKLPPKLRDALLLTAAGDLTQEEVLHSAGIFARELLPAAHSPLSL